MSNRAAFALGAALGITLTARYLWFPPSNPRSKRT